MEEGFRAVVEGSVLKFCLLHFPKDHRGTFITAFKDVADLWTPFDPYDTISIFELEG